jgi:head-tail adaptor
VSLGAGAFDTRARFERRVLQPADAFGNVLPAVWTAMHTRWVRLRPEFGREQIEAGRLESTARAVLTVRRDADTACVAADWRAVITSGPWEGQSLNIRSITPVSMGEIEMTGEFGVAD